MKPSVPAVVLGFQQGGLGVARSLGRLGVPVHGVDRDPRAPGFASRYCRTAHVWDWERVPAADTLAFLDDLGRTLGPAVLITTTDAAAVLVAQHAEELAPRFLFPRPSAGLVRALTDKREVFRLARQFGVPTPAVIWPQSGDDVVRFLSHASFPIVLKGINPGRLERRTGRRLLVVHTPESLLRWYTEWEDVDEPNLMLQEYIPGDDETVWMFNGLFNEWSDCVAAFTGQKMRQYPVRGGGTSLGVCAKNETVARLTMDFMRALRYQGVLDIDYRYDARDGLYKLLDPNPRIGATFRLFVDERGMDVARFLYFDLTGQPVWPARMREGRKRIVEDADVRSSLQRVREGSLTLRDWLVSLWGIEEAAWFAQDDRGPFWHMSRHLVGWGLRGIARWLFAFLVRRNRTPWVKALEHAPLQPVLDPSGSPSRHDSDHRNLKSDLSALTARGGVPPPLARRTWRSSSTPETLR